MATYYWVGGSGNWDNATQTNWATVSGGAGGNGPPTNNDDVVFDANSGTAAVVNVAATAVSYITTVNKSDINILLSGSPTLCALLLTLTRGTITLNNNTLTTFWFNANNSNARAIAFGTGNITINGNAATVWNVSTATGFTYTGTPTVNLTYAGATGTRSITHGSSAGGTETNTPNFNVTAGTDTISSANGANFKNLDLTGFSGTLDIASRNFYGDLTVSTGTTVTGGGNGQSFLATSGVQKITTNGKTLDFPITQNGAGGTVQLQDNLTMGSTRSFTLTNGTFDANGKNVTLGRFDLGAGTKTLTLGSGTWTVTGSGTAWNANTNVTNLTVSASTGTINMTSASTKTFAGGAKTWPTLNQGGAGALTIQQSNTFANITNTVQPATITLTSGTTQTVTSFGVSGTAGNLITLNSSAAGSQATLSDASGTNSVSFVSIKDINATGGAAWSAFITSGNVDAGNNTGWDFLVQLGRYMYNVRKSKRILQQGVI